jgi:tRNA(Ile)-lysidine synthase
MILESVIENLEAEGLLKAAPRTHLVLGYSGGADSTALLFLLNDIKQKLPLDVTAAYFNHRWRDNPPEELPLVHQNCLKANTPLVIIQADLTIPKTESAARQARYKQLTRLANDLRADAVVTAHHADDQIETLLFRILRGTGIDGLAGIQKRLILDKAFGSPIPILRPFLDIARRTIREYLQEHNLNYFEDPTNLDIHRQRNNIRHNILPVLENAYPQVKNSLFRLSLVADGDLQIIEDAIQGIWQSVYGEDKEGPHLDAVRFNQLGLPYQRRVLKQFLTRQDIHPDFHTIEDILLFIRGEGRKKMDASLKSLIKTEDGKTRFLSLYKSKLRLIAEPEQQATAAAAVPVSIPGPAPLPELDVSLFALPWHEPEKVSISPIRPNDSQQVYVDLSAFVDKPLEFRTRRPGDKFQPIGMDVPMRFKKFLINRGVPRFERNRTPVLAHGNQVLWAPGLGISKQLQIKDKATPTHLLKLLAGINHPTPPPPPKPEPEPEPRRMKPEAPEDILEVDELPEVPTGAEPA